MIVHVAPDFKPVTFILVTRVVVRALAVNLIPLPYTVCSCPTPSELPCVTFNGIYPLLPLRPLTTLVGRGGAVLRLGVALLRVLDGLLSVLGAGLRGGRGVGLRLGVGVALLGRGVGVGLLFGRGLGLGLAGLGFGRYGLPGGGCALFLTCCFLASVRCFF